jgi:flavodoxin
MKFLVVYFSRGGRTRKVAETITQELGCEAVDVKKEIPDVSAVELLIVGSGNYGGKPGNELLDFLNNLQPSSKSEAAVFVTSGGPDPKCVEVMEETLETKGYKVISSFKCRGQFLFANRGHPTEDDLKNAKAFASDLQKRIQS